MAYGKSIGIGFCLFCKAKGECILRRVQQTSASQLSVLIHHAKKSTTHLSLKEQFLEVIDLYPDIIAQEILLEVADELDRMVALKSLKEMIYEWFATIVIQNRRRTFGLKTSAQSYHMIFRGNPGTGKTTVARLMGKLFHALGVLSRGHLIEVERADLVGEYIGHTAQRTRELIRKAEGGILFIDEAYALTRGGDKDFGREAIDTLVKSMEDLRHQFILILAGYEAEMNMFLRANPGLPSRFPVMVTFPDYQLDELLDIAERMSEAREYRLDRMARMKLSEIIRQEMEIRTRPFSNARFVRNVVERAIRRHAVRTVKTPALSKDTLMTLKAEDFSQEGSFHHD